ncbi:hypothetical protein [Longimicrobium sp.]|uniref:hypothetical protein n=1 Tax=Longimicrobium sp. TaxID=2029185 RepID=UPI002D171F0C|nr:hypothetical protein [Longimicrobium sp.]HSU15065.1 hypothetical protein [Longimicrobium sp.]
MDAPQREPRGPERLAGASPGSRADVLLMADGDLDTHAVYGTFLESRGFALVHAYSPGECIRLARSMGFAGVVASVGRRGILPWESFRELAGLASGAGFAIVCITTDPYVAAHCRRLAPEAARVLMLPCSPRRLAAAMRRALRHRPAPQWQ